MSSLVLLLLCAPGGRDSAPVSYRRQIAPIFAASCNACHGGPTPQSGLTLSSYATLMKGGRRGKAIMPGKPEQSLLAQLVEGKRQPRMPIGGSLGPAEIALIRRWIAAGARSDGEAAVSGAAPLPKIALTVKVLPQVASVAFSRDGRWLAAGTYQRVLVFDAESGRLARTLAGHAEVVRALAFSPDGSMLAAAGGAPAVGGELKLWSVPAWSPAQTVIGHADSIYGLAWRPDGRQIATTSYDKTVKLWEPAKKEPTSDLREHAEAVFAAAYSPSGRLYATAGADRSIRVWDAAAARRLYTLAGHTDVVSSLAFHPSADQLASGSSDKTVRIWSLKSDGGELMKTLKDHPDGVTDVRFSPDGRLLAAACADGIVLVWNVAEEKVMHQIDAADEAALALDFDPKGARLAVGGYDGSLKVYNLVDGKLAATLIAAPRRSSAR